MGSSYPSEGHHKGISQCSFYGANPNPFVLRTFLLFLSFFLSQIYDASSSIIWLHSCHCLNDNPNLKSIRLLATAKSLNKSFTFCCHNSTCAHAYKPKKKLNSLSSQYIFLISNINYLNSSTYPLSRSCVSTSLMLPSQHKQSSKVGIDLSIPFLASPMSRFETALHQCYHPIGYATRVLYLPSNACYWCHLLFIYNMSRLEFHQINLHFMPCDNIQSRTQSTSKKHKEMQKNRMFNIQEKYPIFYYIKRNYNLAVGRGLH